MQAVLPLYDPAKSLIQAAVGILLFRQYHAGSVLLQLQGWPMAGAGPNRARASSYQLQQLGFSTIGAKAFRAPAKI